MNRNNLRLQTSIRLLAVILAIVSLLSAGVSLSLVSAAQQDRQLGRGKRHLAHFL